MNNGNKKRSGQTGIEANKEQRNKRFVIRFSEDELQTLKTRAANSGASSTALFARAVLLPINHLKDQETKAEHKLRLQLLASLGKIGSNVNQIARSLNRLQMWNDTTKELLLELVKVQEALAVIAVLFKGKK